MTLERKKPATTAVNNNTGSFRLAAPVACLQQNASPTNGDKMAPPDAYAGCKTLSLVSDVPIDSRNSPATMNILACGLDHEQFTNSVLCLDNDGAVQVMLTSSRTAPASLIGTSCSASSSPSRLISSSAVLPMSGTAAIAYGPANTKGFFDGVFGCLRPVLSFIGKTTAAELKQQDDWEIPFENISDLQWLGSGSQGAVFLGQLNHVQVAVKKVRDVKETDIRHLRKLNHPNIISFKGVCTQAPCFCIVMEYCPYGQLYDVLRDGKQLPASLLCDWAKQIAAGMLYLHGHKIIHRDLKSPNVLIAANDIIKISDFGTSREWNEKSTKMSFAGTVAWMAPEVIRNEPCSEKVDVWSFGVVLWELLVHEVPYKDVDSSAIIWGVGSNSLHLPVPNSCPDGFKLLMMQCWSAKPRNRPSFRQIQMHLEIASPDWLSIAQDDFCQLQLHWKEEIAEQLQIIQVEGSNCLKVEEDLIKKRKDELRHAQDVREHYERKLERANNLYMELTACMLQLEKREQELIRREQLLNTGHKRHVSILQPVICKAQNTKVDERLRRLRRQSAADKLTTRRACDAADILTAATDRSPLSSPARSRCKPRPHSQKTDITSSSVVSPACRITAQHNSNLALCGVSPAHSTGNPAHTVQPLHQAQSSHLIESAVSNSSNCDLLTEDKPPATADGLADTIAAILHVKNCNVLNCNAIENGSERTYHSKTLCDDNSDDNNGNETDSGHMVASSQVDVNNGLTVCCRPPVHDANNLLSAKKLDSCQITNNKAKCSQDELEMHYLHYSHTVNMSDEEHDAVAMMTTAGTGDDMISSTCSDSIALELTTSTSDGLSDKENIVRLLKNQMKTSSARLSATSVIDESSLSESEGPFSLDVVISSN